MKLKKIKFKRNKRSSKEIKESKIRSKEIKEA